MTQSSHARGVTPSLYLQEFVDSLQNPTRIWDHAFRYQISEGARTLLFVLSTLGDETSLDNMDKAFWKFYEFRQKRFGFPTGPGDWINALKELDGNFIKTKKIADFVVVSFHSPSIRDFMEKFLETSDSDAIDLLRAACFFEQYTTLWTGVHGHRYRGIERARDEFVKILTANLWQRSARTIRMVNRKGETIGLSSDPPSNEARFRFLLGVLDELQSPVAQQIIDAVLTQLGELWKQGSADKVDLFNLLRTLTKRGFKQEEQGFIAAQKCLLSSPESDEDFRAAADFYKNYPDAVTVEEYEALRDQFKEFASDHPAKQSDDPDWISSAVADLEYVGEQLNVDTERYRHALMEQADEIESERAGSYDPDDYEEDWRGSGSSPDDVNSMFDGLESDLREA